MVIYETLTVLRKLKQNDNKLQEVYDFLVNSENINILEDIIFHDNALRLTFNNPIGFFDNLSYIVMKNNNIRKIASFDEDFDKLKGILRIH
jgi:predicted nucleic acid-binding protein